MTPTQRTLAELRRLGFTAQVVEKWIAPARRRVDLFHCIDIVAMRENGRILGIQTCAGASHAARREKALREPQLAIWLSAFARFEIWSWAKRGGRDERKLWTLRRQEITASDMIAAAEVAR